VNLCFRGKENSVFWYRVNFFFVIADVSRLVFVFYFPTLKLNALENHLGPELVCAWDYIMFIIYIYLLFLYTCAYAKYYVNTYTTATKNTWDQHLKTNLSASLSIKHLYTCCMSRSKNIVDRGLWRTYDIYATFYFDDNNNNNRNNNKIIIIIIIANRMSHWSLNNLIIIIFIYIRNMGTSIFFWNFFLGFWMKRNIKKLPIYTYNFVISETVNWLT